MANQNQDAALKELRSLVVAAKEACAVIQTAHTDTKNAALRRIAERLQCKKDDILAANKKDMEVCMTSICPGHCDRCTPRLGNTPHWTIPVLYKHANRS